MAVPVGQPEARLGILILDSMTLDNAFDESDLHVASVMANHAAGALRNARLLALATERQNEIEAEGSGPAEDLDAVFDAERRARCTATEIVDNIAGPASRGPAGAAHTSGHSGV